MNPLIQLKNLIAICFVVLALSSFGVPWARAVSPQPDGGYPGRNTAEGDGALLSLSTGGYNTALGWFSLRNDTAGGFNTAIGAGSLLANSADQNTATGAGALFSNTTGGQNTANGTFALFFNTIGVNNTANGQAALLDNTTGSENTATGAGALLPNATGSSNTANGFEALFSNTTGSNNTAIGSEALLHNTTNNDNTAIGSGALAGNTTGGGNTAIGDEALAVSTTGSDNIALGLEAGLLVSTASGVISIGHAGADVSNTTWIGNVYNIATQSGTTAPVIISDGGQLGTVVSSERFKKDIASMDKASEIILSLRPVTFHYKTDTKGTAQFGLIAEEVAKVNPALVLPDKEGKPYTVRYEAVNAMLLNEFLKARRQIDAQQKQIEALTAGLQKVSAQLELSKSAPQTVLNDQ